MPGPGGARSGGCAWSEGVSALGVSAPRGVSAPGEGGVCSGGVSAPGGWVSQHALRQTPPPPVDRHTLVKILLWPNFVAAGNNKF